MGQGILFAGGRVFTGGRLVPCEVLVRDGRIAAVGTDLERTGCQVVELSAGQTLTGSTACELLLRSGTATCVSDSSPGLVDMTDGATLANGGALKANHLYLATIEGRGVHASTAVTIMVRGEYTVS